MKEQFGNEIYRSPKTLSFLATGFLGGILLCDILFVVLSFGLLVFPDKKMTLPSGEIVSLAFVFISFISILHGFLFVAAIVFFLIWEFRAFKNLSPLRAQNSEFTPGWAVGWWFIPFANLVKPYQAMSDLWTDSDPDFDAEGGFLSNAVGAPRIMGWWWALFIVSNILLNITSLLSNGRASDIGADFAAIFLVANIIRGADAFLIIKIIRDITRNQDLRFQKLGELGDFNTPPPPPQFSQNG